MERGSGEGDSQGVSLAFLPCFGGSWEIERQEEE